MFFQSSAAMLLNTNLSTAATTLTKWLVSIPSVSSAKGSSVITQSIYEGLGEFPYFKQHPEHLVLVPHKNDSRSSIVALVKTIENIQDTLVLLCDVDTNSPAHYGILKNISTQSDELERQLLKLVAENQSLKQKLEQHDALFGLGVLESKCATGCMLAALKELSDNHVRLNLNILFVCTSGNAQQHQGIKQCIPVMQELCSKENLTLRLTLNAQPQLNNPTFANSAALLNIAANTIAPRSNSSLDKDSSGKIHDNVIGYTSYNGVGQNHNSVPDNKDTFNVDASKDSVQSNNTANALASLGSNAALTSSRTFCNANFVSGQVALGSSALALGNVVLGQASSISDIPSTDGESNTTLNQTSASVNLSIDLNNAQPNYRLNNPLCSGLTSHLNSVSGYSNLSDSAANIHNAIQQPLTIGKPELCLYTGNYGKIEPSFYILGQSSSINQPFAGFSASLIAAELIHEFELNPKILQKLHQKPLLPTFDSLKVKDFGKEFSPDGVQLSFNLPMLPAIDLSDVLELMKEVAAKAIENAAEVVDEREAILAKLNNQPFVPQIQDAEVISFSDLLERACSNYAGDIRQAVTSLIRKCHKEGFNTQQSAITIIERLNDFAQLPRPSIVVYFTDNLVPAQSLNASNYQDRELFMLLDTLMHSFARETKLHAHMSTHYAPTDAGFLRPEGLEKSEALLEQESPLGFDKLPSLNVPTVTLGMLGGNLSHVTEYVEASMCKYLPQFVLHLVDTLASNPLGQSHVAQPHDDLQLHLEELGQRAEEIAAAALNEIRAVDQQSRQSTGFYSQVSQGTLSPETLSYKDFKRKQRQQQQQIQADNVAANIASNTVSNAVDNVASKTAQQAATSLDKPLGAQEDTESQLDPLIPESDSKLASKQTSKLELAVATESDYATIKDTLALEQETNKVGESDSSVASDAQELAPTDAKLSNTAASIVAETSIHAQTETNATASSDTKVAAEQAPVNETQKSVQAQNSDQLSAKAKTHITQPAQPTDKLNASTEDKLDQTLIAESKSIQTNTEDSKIDTVHAANANIQLGLSGELLIRNEAYLDPEGAPNSDQHLLQNSPEHVELHNIAPSLAQAQHDNSTQSASLAKAATNTEQSTLSTTQEKNIAPVTVKDNIVAETQEQQAVPETKEQETATTCSEIADSVVPANSLSSIPVDSLVVDNTAEPVAVLSANNSVAVNQTSSNQIALDTESDSLAADRTHHSPKTNPEAEHNLDPNATSDDVQMQPEAIPELTKVALLPQTATEHQIIDQAQQKIRSAIGSFKKLFSSNLMHKTNKNIEPQLKINEVAPKAKESDIDQALAAASAIALAINNQDQNEHNNVSMGFTATDGEDLSSTAVNGKLVNVGKLVADTDVVDEQLTKSKLTNLSQQKDEHKTKYSASSILDAAAETQLVSKISAFGSLFGLGKDKNKHKDNPEKAASDHTSTQKAASAQTQVLEHSQNNTYNLTHNNADDLSSAEQLSATKDSVIELTSGAFATVTTSAQAQTDILVVPSSSKEVVTDNHDVTVAAQATSQHLNEKLNGKQSVNNQQVINQQLADNRTEDSSAHATVNSSANAATNSTLNNELSAEAATKSKHDESTLDATSVNPSHAKSVQASAILNQQTQAASESSKSSDVHISVTNMANTTIVCTNETEQHQSAAIADESFTHYEEESANGNTIVIHNALAHMETPHAVMPTQDTIISGHEMPHEQLKLGQSNTLITHNRQAFVSTRGEDLPPLQAEVKATPLSTLISKPMPTQLHGSSLVNGSSSVLAQTSTQEQTSVQNKPIQDKHASAQSKLEQAHTAKQVNLESTANTTAQSSVQAQNLTEPTAGHEQNSSAHLPAQEQTAVNNFVQTTAQDSHIHSQMPLDKDAAQKQQQTLESGQLSHSTLSEEDLPNAEQSLAQNDTQIAMLHTVLVKPEDTVKNKETEHCSQTTAAIYTNVNDSTAVNTNTHCVAKDSANNKAASANQAPPANRSSTIAKSTAAQQTVTATAEENSSDTNLLAEDKLAANIPDLSTPQEAMRREAALLQIETIEDATKSLALDTIEQGFSSSYSKTTIEGLSLEKLDPAQAFAQLLGEIEEDDSAKNNFRTDYDSRKPSSVKSKNQIQKTAAQLQTVESNPTTAQQQTVEHNQVSASQMQSVTQSQTNAKSNEALNSKLNSELASKQNLISPAAKGSMQNATPEASASTEQTALASESQQSAQVANQVKKTTRQANRSQTSKHAAETSVSLRSSTQMLAQSTMQDNASMQSGTYINSMDYAPQQSNYAAPASSKAYVPKDSNFYGDLELPTTQHVTRSLAPNVTGGSATLRTLKSMPTAQVKPSPAKIRSSQLAAKRGGVAGVPGLAGAAGVLGTGDGRTTISDLNPEPVPTSTRPTRRTGQSIGGLNKGISNNSYYGPMASAITSTLIESRPAVVSAAFNGIENAISTSLRSSGVQAKTSPAPINTQSTKNSKGGLGPGVTPRRQVLKPDAGGNNRDYANLATAMSAARLRNTKIRTPLKLNEPANNLSASKSLNERRAALHKAMYGGLDEEIAVVNPVLGQDSKLAGNGDPASQATKVNRMESAIGTKSELKKPSAVKNAKAVDKSAARNKPKGSFIAFDKGDFLNYDPTTLTASFEDSGEVTEEAATPKMRRVSKAKNKPE